MAESTTKSRTASILEGSAISLGIAALGWLSANFLRRKQYDHDERLKEQVRKIAEGNEISSGVDIPIIYGTRKVAVGYADKRQTNLRVNKTGRPEDDDGGILVLVPTVCVASENGSDIGGFEVVFFDDKVAISRQQDISNTVPGAQDVLPTGSESILGEKHPRGDFVKPPFNKQYIHDLDPNIFNPRLRNHLTWIAHYGGWDSDNLPNATSRVVDPELHRLFPNHWPISSTGAGIAYLSLFLVFDEEIFQGDPKISVLVRGRRVWDPRLGPRSDNSNWIFSTNPVLCALDYMMSKLGWSLSVSQFHIEDWEDAADYCDIKIATPDRGFQKIYECNAILETSASRQENLTTILTSCRGQVIQENGKYSIVINQRNNGPVLINPNDFNSGIHLTEDDIKEIVESRRAGFSERPNRIEVSFPNKFTQYNQAFAYWPPINESGDLINDNSTENVQRVGLLATTDGATAQHIAQTIYEEQRADKEIYVIASPSMKHCRLGNVINLTYDRIGFDTPTLVLVTAVAHLENGDVGLVLREYNKLAYLIQSTAIGDVDDVVTQNINAVGPPTMVKVVSTDETTISGSPAILATWKEPDDVFVTRYELQYRPSAAEGEEEKDWISWQDVAKGTKRALISPVNPSIGYDFRIRSVNIWFIRSVWVDKNIETAASNIPSSNDLQIFETNWNTVERTISAAIPSRNLAITLSSGIKADRLLMFLRYNGPSHSPLRYAYWLTIAEDNRDGSGFVHIFRGGDRDPHLIPAGDEFDFDNPPSDLETIEQSGTETPLYYEADVVQLGSGPNPFSLFITPYLESEKIGTTVPYQVSSSILPQLQDLANMDSVPNGQGQVAVFDMLTQKFNFYPQVKLVTTRPSASDADFVGQLLALREAENRPPIVSAEITDQDTNEGDTDYIVLDSYFSDPDRDILNFEASSSNTAAVTVSVQGSTLTINSISEGTATITVTASDGSLTVQDEFTVTVGAPANNAPVLNLSLPDITVTVGQNSSTQPDLDDYFSDPDGDTLSYSAESSNNSRATVTINSNNELIVRGVAIGSVTITVTATDPGGLSASDTLTATVEAALPPPAPGVPANLRIVRGTPTPTNFSITWDAVAGADSYDLEVGFFFFGAWNDNFGRNGITGTSQAFVTADVSGVRGRARVRARNTGGVSAWSGYITFTET